MLRLLFVFLFLVGCGGNESPQVVTGVRTTTMMITAPEFYDDGTELYYEDISHYKVSYGTDPSNLYLSYDVTGLLFDFTEQTGVTWYVVVQTVDVYGNVSEMSNVKVLAF